MIDICQPGDTKYHSFSVSNEHFPAFEGSEVHEVCSTYVLAREVEWTTRMFVIPMLEENEEGIGTMLNLDHKSPAFEGDQVKIKAIVDSMKGNELICSFSVSTGDRLIAEGKTGQKIYKRKKLKQIFSDYKK